MAGRRNTALAFDCMFTACVVLESKVSSASCSRLAKYRQRTSRWFCTRIHRASWSSCTRRIRMSYDESSFVRASRTISGTSRQVLVLGKNLKLGHICRDGAFAGSSCRAGQPSLQPHSNVVAWLAFSLGSPWFLQPLPRACVCMLAYRWLLLAEEGTEGLCTSGESVLC